MVGGTPTQAGFPNGVGGVSPWVCGSGIERSISFVFASAIGPDVAELCDTIAHEVGHQFGLDHEFLSTDPMSYFPSSQARPYQDTLSECGTNRPIPCECSTLQNSHQHLSRLAGANREVFASGFEASEEASRPASIFPSKRSGGDSIRCGTDTALPTWRPTAPLIESSRR